MNKLTIGTIELDSPIILAPMAGVTNQAFKMLVRELGAGLICTEMVSDKAILHKNEKTLKMLEINEREHPVAIQIFGSNPVTMAEAAKYIQDNTDFDIIDINMGCPAPKIVKNQSGSKLLLDTNKVYEITKAVVDAVDIPVMVKMRLGWDENNINVLDNAKAVQKAGAKAIAIHGRTTNQMYRGIANWELIKLVKSELSIPVFGNGDITSCEIAKARLEETGVDGLMIGRAALGKPWIIKQIHDFLETGKLSQEPPIKIRLDICLQHLNYLVELKGEKVAVMEMRGLVANYLKGLPSINKYKQQFQTIISKAEFENLINYLKNNYEENIMNKVFFFDIDDTLLPKGQDRVISQNTIDALNKLQENGHEVIIATGKSISMIEKPLEMTGIGNYITSNGQVLTLNHKIAYHNPISNQDIQKWIDLADKLGCHVSFQTSGDFYLLERPNWEEAYNNTLHSVNVKPPILTTTIPNEDVYQILLLNNVQELENTELIPGYRSVKWHPKAYDILPTETSKAYAIQKYLDIVGPRKVYAFGDGLNDIEMFELADVSVAVGNAHDKLKAVADHVTDTCENDGVYKFLKANKLI